MAAVTLESGVYFIQNLGTGTVIDLDGGSSKDSTKVQGFDKHELNDGWVPAQLWVISKIGNDNAYSIQNANSRTYMDLTGSLSANGTPVIGYQGTGNPNQKWAITRSANKNAISNLATNTYVDLTGGNKANGTKIQCWWGEGPSTKNNNQLWQIIRA